MLVRAGVVAVAGHVKASRVSNYRVPVDKRSQHSLSIDNATASTGQLGLHGFTEFFFRVRIR